MSIFTRVSEWFNGAKEASDMDVMQQVQPGDAWVRVEQERLKTMHEKLVEITPYQAALITAKTIITLQQSGDFIPNELHELLKVREKIALKHHHKSLHKKHSAERKRLRDEIQPLRCKELELELAISAHQEARA